MLTGIHEQVSTITHVAKTTLIVLLRIAKKTGFSHLYNSEKEICSEEEKERELFPLFQSKFKTAGEKLSFHVFYKILIFKTIIESGLPFGEFQYL